MEHCCVPSPPLQYLLPASQSGWWDVSGGLDGTLAVVASPSFGTDFKFCLVMIH